MKNDGGLLAAVVIVFAFAGIGALYLAHLAGM